MEPKEILKNEHVLLTKKYFRVAFIHKVLPKQARMKENSDFGQ